ncbi:site-specific tyrosine recombinase/integron integrase [Psychroserpens sp. SPM9]|uniref:site-specific tyrosine recombinase/integron integrase n=1 Tax=Psychroserpens sp. SPM9 TaxID=2975598 RepID=UPI0021A61461|nr:site-specific tyrosine recombinase/integron integrase [Psychroserpens sp. SPM9]MDG5491669.1 site-specific integrase [Psychroserpens sp. SPM9]
MASKPIIKIGRIRINGEPYITVNFKYNSKFKNLMRRIQSAKWSYTLRTWIIKDNAVSLNRFYYLFSKISLIEENKLFKKKEKREFDLSEQQKYLLNAFYKYLKGKRYSKSTIQTYVFGVADFISFNASKPLSELQNRDVELFIEEIYIKRHYSVSTQRQFISALKLFLLFESSTQIDSLELMRPYKSKKLPIVLSQQEVLRLIQKTSNLKHRTIIALLYSCGLRISELLNLRVTDIDINRRQIHIKRSKGRKDRYVGMAESFLPLCLNYVQTYEPRLYFIENKQMQPYSAESVRAFLRRNCKKAGIIKRVTPHTLRHSYATHMLEQGVNIRYIQSLLGHSRPETTMIYTHIKRQDLLEISNPLDVAVYKLSTTDKQTSNVVLSRKNLI